MGKVKDKLYYYFANKNWGVNLEYEPFVDTHEKYKKCRLKRLWLLLKLNFHYRVLRKKTPMLKETIERLKISNSRNASKIQLPYLEGSESEGLKRRYQIYLARELMEYDIVSFDVFDTLIFRPFRDHSFETVISFISVLYYKINS